MNLRKYVNSLPEEKRELGSRILDKAEIALKRRQVQYTDFLDPGQQVFCNSLLGNRWGLSHRFIGGYEEAERKRMALFPEDQGEMVEEEGICFLEVKGSFRFQKVSHRDFLGGILGIGIKRGKIGDILLTDKGCQVILAKEVKEFVITNLSKIHQVPVWVEEIDAHQLEMPELKIKEIQTTVASLRLDVVAGAGFGLSRSRIAQYIAADKVKVNWELKNNPASIVKEGDNISVRGFGRLKIGQIKGITKKGRISILILRYI